jgi:hypothetical protein
MYHHNVARMLFLDYVNEPNPCTHIKNPNADGYKKLGRAMKYLYSTLNMDATRPQSRQCTYHGMAGGSTHHLQSALI